MGHLAVLGLESFCTFHVGIFLFFTCGCNTFAFPTPENATTITVLRDERKLDSSGSGKYSYSVELSDGTKLEQQGEKASDGGNSLVVSGRYAFVDPTTGVTHEVEYTADKTGYHPHVISPQDRENNMLSKNAASNRTDENEKPLETISASLFSSQSASF
ncbi:Larval cuticle protein 5 [Orchesella cincta]|uniref:Larval cuticle protein 5 n=1 Tax=Orchesella cincta TaxID=48709 RepID=A0A1D2M1Z8_ORCCI|nr:Larval cuticle protein 5 [Orchesella cincta]